MSVGTDQLHDIFSVKLIQPQDRSSSTLQRKQKQMTLKLPKVAPQNEKDVQKEFLETENEVKIKESRQHKALKII